MAKALDASTYSKQIEQQQKAAQKYVESSLRYYLKADPDFDTAAFRSYAIEVLSQSYYKYGDAAAALAVMRYDKTMKALGVDVDGAEIANEWLQESVASSVNYYVKQARTHGAETVIKGLGSKAKDQPRKAANRTTIANAKRDAKKGVYYARIPSGTETCGFCLMLASRGFVYGSKEKAGFTGMKYNSFHNGCDCTIVAGARNSTVEGYDPDWYYAAYLDARRTCGGDDMVTICDEIELRAPQWAWHHGSGTADYSKRPRADLTAHEQSGVDTLCAHGFNVALREVNPRAPANLGIRMNGRLWDMVNVTDAGGSLTAALEQARAKWEALALDVKPCIVITTDGLDIPFAELCEEVMARKKPGEQILVVSSTEMDEETGLSKIRRF